jgi:hypothetical protein
MRRRGPEISLLVDAFEHHDILARPLKVVLKFSDFLSDRRRSAVRSALIVLG